tara:strand:+ start:407 stop:511 length:105 start_codon:yes stop_codon:yes gene_type:complete
VENVVWNLVMVVDTGFVKNICIGIEDVVRENEYL